MKIIHHQIECGISRCNFGFQHQEQVSPTTHFVDRDGRAFKYRAQAYGPHELRRFGHAICFQNDMGHPQRRT